MSKKIEVKDSEKFQLNPRASEWSPGSQSIMNPRAAFSRKEKVKKPPDDGFMKDPRIEGPPRPLSKRHAQYIPVVITEPKAPWDFYVVTKETLGPLNSMIEEMTKWYNSRDVETILNYEDIKIWGFYAAKVMHSPNYFNKWVRVLVLGKPENSGQQMYQVKCAVIDLGGVQFIEYTRLRFLRQAYVQLPWGAYRGCIKTIDNKEFEQRTLKRYQAERGFRNMVQERGGEFLGMVVEEIPPEPKNLEEPFIIWEIFLLPHK